MKRFAAALSVALCAGAAFGQTGLIIGVDDATVPIYIYNESGQWQPLLTGYAPWGAAVDPSTCTLYFNAGGSLYRYSREDADATLIDTLTFNGSTTNVVSLAFYNGILYGTKNIATEAVYSINTTTAEMTLVYAYPAADFDFGGLDIDPDTGIMYGTNDDATPLGTGIYSFDLENQSTSFVAPYPTEAQLPGNSNDIDGLAAGGGKLWLAIDNAGGIGVYDIATGQYEAPLTNPYSTSEVFAAAAWGPCFFGGGGCPVCAADYDQSGGVDGDDITAFFNDWQAGAPCGDVDGSGGVDGDDIPFFFDRWQAGGCN